MASKRIVSSILCGNIEGPPFSLSTLVGAPLGLVVAFNSTPPPLDAVIVFSRLTI
jgi:hypothetical protein